MEGIGARWKWLLLANATRLVHAGLSLKSLRRLRHLSVHPQYIQTKSRMHVASHALCNTLRETLNCKQNLDLVKWDCNDYVG